MSFLSGAFFSPHSFPRVLQVLADALPLTYFIRLTRDVMLHNHHLWANWSDIAVVVAWGAVGAFVAATRFRWEPTEG
jgi:ABC-type multidrug transport system permease subunit